MPKGLQARLDAHNAVVTSWNERGGAPAEEYLRLERELAALREEGEHLKRLLADFNDDVAAVNDLVAQINEVAEKNNLDVEYFIGAFVESRELNRGSTTGPESRSTSSIRRRNMNTTMPTWSAAPTA